MSKSLGNLFTLDDIRERGHTAEEVRYVLLSEATASPLILLSIPLRLPAKR